jgi:hypothetical protein
MMLFSSRYVKEVDLPAEAEDESILLLVFKRPGTTLGRG